MIRRTGRFARGAAIAATIVLAGAAPAAAEDDASNGWSQAADLIFADEARGAVPERRLPVVGLRLRPAPVGIAVEVAEGVHVGAAGNFDPERDDLSALIALRLSL